MCPVSRISRYIAIRRKSPRHTVALTLDAEEHRRPGPARVEVNGTLVDIREMPREVQVIAFEKGMIPYIPADQE